MAKRKVDPKKFEWNAEDMQISKDKHLPIQDRLFNALIRIKELLS